MCSMKRLFRTVSPRTICVDDGWMFELDTFKVLRKSVLISYHFLQYDDKNIQ